MERAGSGSRTVMALAALLTCAAASDSPAGQYRLVGQPDVVSGLVLEQDGRFAYMLSAGALDERATGRWTSDERAVYLTTDPRPKPAEFIAGKAVTNGSTPLSIKVSWPNGGGVAGVDVTVGFDSGPPAEGYTQEYGWTLADDERRTPRWIELSVPMFGLASSRLPIDVSSGNELSFTLVPNDLGIANFDRQPLALAEGRLVMERHEMMMTYAREDE